MPTVIRSAGFTVKVFGPPREHGPPHVHVLKGNEALLVIRLRLPGAAQTVWSNYGMAAHDVVAAFRLVERNHDLIVGAWERIHGKSDGK